MAIYRGVVALDQSWALSHLTFMITLLDNVTFQTQPHTNRIEKGSKYSIQKPFLTILGKHLGFRSLQKSIFYAWGRRAVKFGQVLLVMCPLRCLQETVRACDTRWLWLHPHHRSPSIYVRDLRHNYSQAEVLIAVWTGYQQKPAHGSFCRPAPNHTKSLFYSLLL